MHKVGRLNYARAELATKQKSSKGVSLYSLYVNRPLGRPVAALAYACRLTPNAVTLISAVLSAAGILVLILAPATWPIGILVWILLASGFVVDSADGQVARLTGTSSVRGEWLDHLVDSGKMVAVHSAVLVSLFRHFDLTGSWELLIPLIFQLAAVVSFFGGTLAAFLLGSRRAAAPPSMARSVALIAVDYGILCLVFVVLGNHDVFLVCYAVLALIHVVFTAGICVKWFVELGRQ